MHNNDKLFQKMPDGCNDVTKNVKRLSILDSSQNEIEQLDEDMIIPGIEFVNYRDESQLESIVRLVGRDLSEPYSGELAFLF